MWPFIPGERFPYANFHAMNQDWILAIIKDFKDKYEHVEELITNGVTTITNTTNTELAHAVQEMETAKNVMLTALNTWYTTHQGYLDRELVNNLAAFNTQADTKAHQTLESIPDDYTALYNEVIAAAATLNNSNISEPNKTLENYLDIRGIANFEGTGGYYEKTYPYNFHEDNVNIHCTGLIYIKGYDSLHARGHLNNNGFAIAFFDARKKLIPEISLSAPSQNIDYVSTSTNLRADAYKNAFYCCVSYYGTESTAANAGLLSCISLPITGNDYSNLESYGKPAIMNNHYYVRSDGVIYHDDTGIILSTGLIPIKRGAALSIYAQMGTIGHVISFFDKYRNFMSTISVLGTGLNYSNFNINTDTNQYNDIAYVMISNYDQENKGCIFITYPETYENELINKIPYMSMQHVYATENGGWDVRFMNPGTTGVHSTPLVYINNKIVDKIQAHTCINPTYYRVAFFDKNKSLITSLSRTNESLAEVDETIDITGSEYDNVRYVAITSWRGPNSDTPAKEHWLYIHCSNFITSIISHIKNLNTNSIFKKVVCVGDSYTKGWFRIPGDTQYSDHPEYAWPHYMEHITGNEWVNLGISGATTWSWLTDQQGLAKAQQEGQTQAYVVGLLINDTGHDLGTPADIGTENNTYYAGLSKVIRSLAAISPQAHIFVSTCPRYRDATYNSFNEAVRYIVNAYTGTYKVHLIDLAANYELFSVDSFKNDFINGHYTAIGYQQMAEFMNYMISDYINNHVASFQDVYKLPYD